MSRGLSATTETCLLRFQAMIIVAKYCDEYVCLSVCLFVCPRKYQSGTTRANFTDFSVRVAYVRGSVLLRHVDDRPHRLSAGRGDGSAQRRPIGYLIVLWYVVH